MSADLLALGVSHKTAPVALRERLALPEGRASGFLNELVAHEAIREAVAISTCNRTELYLVVGDPVEAESVALSALARQAGMRPTELLGRLYALRDVEAYQVADIRFYEPAVSNGKFGPRGASGVIEVRTKTTRR